MTRQRAMDIAREVFPDVPEKELLGILWGHTGYPEFWDGDPEVCVRRQLEQYKSGDCDCPDCGTFGFPSWFPSEESKEN